MIHLSMPLWPRAILNPCQLTSIVLAASDIPPGSKRGDWGVPLRPIIVGETRVNPSVLHSSLPTPWWVKNRPSGS